MIRNGAQIIRTVLDGLYEQALLIPSADISHDYQRD
jgi:hypothetical protein